MILLSLKVGFVNHVQLTNHTQNWCNSLDVLLFKVKGKEVLKKNQKNGTNLICFYKQKKVQRGY